MTTTHRDMTNGKIKPCPRPAICVSTQCRNPNRRMLPLHFDISLDEATQLIVAILNTLPRTTIVAQEYNYILAHCKTALFYFTDEVEFYFDTEKNEIHFRSLSSGGLSDFGSNKRRMQHISARFIKMQNRYLNSKK